MSKFLALTVRKDDASNDDCAGCLLSYIVRKSTVDGFVNITSGGG